MMTFLLRRVRRNDDSGFTLMEMLVAMVISGIMGTVLLAMMFGAQRSTKSTTTADDLNSEALNRISRDLRQAVPTYDSAKVETPGIVAVQNPDGSSHVSGGVTSVTLQADFNGDGCVAGRASQPLPGAAAATVCDPALTPDNTAPEIETFCWDGSGSGAQHLYLVPGTVNAGSCTPTDGSVTTKPLVSGRISDFTLKYRSNLYRYDANGDGKTTWSELDQAGSPVGNDNGVLDTPELLGVSSVVVSITTSDGGSATQTYQTQVDLRNMS
jgi:prepilin-type N-terminal cleavage/methylation domain-containing protein